MATRNIVPRANGEGGIGTPAKHWGNGYFDNLSLAGEDVAGTLSDMDLALAESTGYGIVSGCAPTISGLTVTVAAGVVHLSGGTRKEIASTNITLDAADASNPRIDLVYIDSTGTVAKITGTASASPVVPSVPSGGISVAQVSVAAGATTGTVTGSRGMLARWYNTGVVNVKDFGAVGDGVHDDTAAFIAAFSNGQGSAILIPEGNYNITENLFSENVAKIFDFGTYTNINPAYKNESSIYMTAGVIEHVATFQPIVGEIQSMTYNPNRKELLLGHTNDLVQYIQVIDITTLTEKNRYQYTNLGHINSLEYVDVNDEILVGCNGVVLNGQGSSVKRTISNNDGAICFDGKHSLYFENYGTSKIDIRKSDIVSIIDTIETAGTGTVGTIFNEMVVDENDLIVSAATSDGYLNIYSIAEKLEYIGTIETGTDEIEGLANIGEYIYFITVSGKLYRFAKHKYFDSSSLIKRVEKGKIQPVINYHSLAVTGDSDSYLKLLPIFILATEGRTVYFNIDNIVAFDLKNGTSANGTPEALGLNSNRIGLNPAKYEMEVSVTQNSFFHKTYATFLLFISGNIEYV